MPWSAVQLVRVTLDEISNGKGGGKLSFGLIAALWAASTGMGAISDTLNVAYHVQEKRPWWKVRLVALLLTIALSLFIILALVILFYSGKISSAVTSHLGFGEAFKIIWAVTQWLVALIFLYASFSLTYRFAPDIHIRRRKWFSVGSAISVVLWIRISLAFRLYLHFFNSYSVTYGSLGALIILMLWFYLTD
jgi:membrane protein